jgi:hypothetical protein
MRLLACVTDVIPCPVSDQAWIAASETFTLVDLGINSVAILQVFSWGFGVVLLGWLLGYACGVAVSIIRKI